MGKRKLKSTIKALHQALLGLRPPGSKTTTWICIQQGKTESFREVYKSFNSMYYSSSSTSSDLCSLNEETDARESGHTISTQPSGEESFSITSSSLSTDSNDSDRGELVFKGFISSRRFFFSPCTTKSIMEEANDPEEEEQEMGQEEIAISSERCREEGELMTIEMGFYRKSVTMAMSSDNPYMDFRVSMEEMASAYGLREWSCLQKLLHCYLRLNDQRTHKIIVLAFVDLLMNILADESTSSSSSSDIIISKVNSSEGCFPFPLPLCLDA